MYMANKQTNRFEGDVYFATSLEPSVYGNGSVRIEGNIIIDGSATITGGVDSAHSSLSGLLNDDHIQYLLLTGRTGGQIATGGTASGNNITIRSTTNATKGSVIFDETTTTTSSITGAIRVSGGIGISNTTDAISATNGGSITTAGGLAVAKKAFIGTDLSVSGNITSGVWNGSTVGVIYGGTGSTSFTASTVLLGNGTNPIQNASGLTYISNTLNVPIIVSNDSTASNSSITGAIRVSGGIGISNTTDATSATNGGSITTAGGLAVAQRAFVGGNMSIGGNLTVTGTAALPHSNLTGLLNDDHTQYVLLAGRTGGQILTGGTASGNNVTIRSTSNATKGSVIFDETTATTSSITGAIRVSGGIGISNSTDATSATNGGSITTAGGLAVAQRAFVGGNMSIGGNLTVTGTAALPHSNLTGLLNDDHIQYVLLAGRIGGQILTGGTSSGNNVTIRSTTNATKGSVIFDEITATTSSITGAIRVSGGIGISNSTDATSATNGGTITTAGGLAVAKKAFIGTDLAIGGNITSGLWNGSTIGVIYGGTGSTSFTASTVLLGNGTNPIQNASGLTYISNTLNVPIIVSNDSTTTTSSITGAIRVSGGIGISNTTDATSSTNGGTITTAGGLAVAKKAFIGTDLDVGGNLTVTGTVAIPHGNLTGLLNDDHTQYVLLAGRTGGQILTGGTSSGNNYTIRSTTNATKGSVIFDEITATTSSITGAIRVSGGIGISNTTDATSATNGGTITTAGGLAVAKKAFIGTDLDVGGNLTVTGTVAIPHGNLTGLLNDDHIQYVLLSGRTGGQIVTGGTASGNNVTIRSTSNATKGSVIFDEITATTSSITGAIRVSGGIGISNSTDATSSTNGGSITTAGGLAVAKKAFIGTDLAVGGNLTVTGTAALPHINLTGLLNDDHTQYVLLAGRTGGQIVTGGTSSGNNVTIRSTTNATKGSVIFDETTATTSSITGAIRVSGGIGISNTTDATSATNGGSITTAGGLAVAQRAFVGGNMSIGGNLTVIGTAALPHSNLTGLLNDDHIQYVLLAGRTGGQIVTGGTASGNNVTIRSTTNSTKGSVIFDETTATTSSITGAIRVSGGIGISNSTDATSSTNGGSITTAGGLAVAQRAFVGGNMSIGGNITSGVWNGSTIGVIYGGTGSTSFTSNTVLLGNGTSAIQNATGLTYSLNTLNVPIIVSNDSTASTSSITGAIRVSGGIGISNTTDATSSTNGGTITTAGGLAVSKKIFVGGIGSFENQIDMNNTKIINLAEPTDSSDAVTKQYVDIAIQGLDAKQSVKVATTVSGTMSTSYQNGSIVDGIVLVTGDRILIKNQGNVNNGVYTVNLTGTPSRTLDFANGASVSGSFLFVENGTENGGNGWVCTSTVGNDIVGTSTLTFSQFSGAGSIIAGTGLTKIGNTLSVNPSQTQINQLGTINLGTWNGSTIGVIYGGTGSTSFTSNTVLLGNGTSAIQNATGLTYSLNTLNVPIIVSNDSTASTSSITGAIRVSGGIGISNTADATSATNGGSITTAGGLAVAKKAFIGTDLTVGGNLTVTGTAALPHANLTGLLNDDHTQYMLLSGRIGGQIVTGGTASGNNYTIRSTSNVTKGSVIFDETTATTSSITGAIRVSGGIGISNSTDATSATNGGSITTAGGLAVAQRAFVGGNMSIGGNLTVTGTAALPHANLTGLLNDDHTQYVLLAGRIGGQIVTGGTASGDNYTIRSTSNATKGSVIFDETTATTSSITGAIRVSGGIGISNTTDATSATNGGSITTAGGLAVAQRAFVGGNMSIGGNLTVTGTAALPHANLTGLLNDDHTQYVLLAGRIGGQILTGGTASGNNYTIRSTSNATKGSVIFDETTATTSSITGAILVSGGIGISNTTDATSSTNGGSITTAGGLAVAQRAFVGGNMSIGGNLTVTGTAALPHSNLTGLLNDDHTQYVLLSGRTGGQIVTGGTASGNNVTIRSTSNATKGSVIFDETTATTSSITGAIRVSGGIGISNSTDATSSTNGGSITTAGGLAVAQRAFVGGNMSIGGNLTVTGTFVAPHSNLTGLLNDDHTQYVLLAGRIGGQILTGGTASGNNYTIRSTSNATKGSVIFDEITTSTSSITGAIRVSGGIGISNTTDATSATNGGSITTAGGLAVAQRAFVGGNMSIGGNLTVTGTAALPHINLTGLLNDDHTQYVLLAGRIGGQILTGGTASGNNYTIRSTSNVTKGSVIFDETTATISSITGAIRVSGGIGISNTTDATSSTNGGTITTAGGLAVAKKAFIGSDLSVGGSLTVSGGFISPHSNLTGLLNDDHTQYLLLAGRIGGQIITGGTASGNDLILRTTTNTTKGTVLLDETTASTSSITGCLRLSGGLGISNNADATSITNGGSFTTAGGLAVAQKAFIGSTLNTGSITINNSSQNVLNIDCQNSAVSPGRIIFTNTGGTGDFSITGDGGDIVWQGGGGRAMQFGAWHEVRIFGGRATGVDLPQIAGSNSSFNTIIQNSNDSIGLRVQAITGQTQNLTQWTSSAGIVYSFIDNLGNISLPNMSLTGYIQMSSIVSPANPGGAQFRYYTDSSDSLLKSKNSSGTVTVYQPCNTKGDVGTHDGTTNVRLPVGVDGSFLQADSTSSTGLSWMGKTYAYIRDEKTLATNAGAATSGAFSTRTLNTATYEPSTQTDIILSGNNVNLEPGKYKIDCTVPAHKVNGFTSRLFNVTNNSVLLLGSSEYSNGADTVTSVSRISGIIIITVSTDIRVEMRVQTSRSPEGLGRAHGFQTEVYTQLFIEKI